MKQRLMLSALVVLVLTAGLVALASLPTGAATYVGVVPDDGRVAAEARVGGDARVLLLSRRGRLQLLVAYHRPKGWFGARVAPAPIASPAAWAATRGSSRVPSFSATYGRVEGAEVRVRWADGRESSARVARDGSYLLARAGRIRATDVAVVDADGGTSSLGAP